VEFIYRSKLFKQLVVVTSLLVVLAIGIPSAFALLYMTPHLVEDRYYQVIKTDADFLAARLDWLLEKSLKDVDYLSNKMQIANPSQVEESGEVLDIFVKSSAIFTGGVVTDPAGNILLFNSSPQGNIKLKQINNIGDRDYIRYPLAEGKNYLSDVVITVASPLPVIFVSNTVKQNGQPVGVLALSINLWNQDNVFQSLVYGFQEKRHANIYVVDRQGTIVFHKDKQWVGKTINPDILSEIAAGEDRDEKQGIIDNISTEEGNVALAYARLKTNNWMVINEISHRQIYAMSKIARVMSLGTMALVFVLGLLASVLFAKIILKPLGAITIATEQVAAGDLTRPIEYKGHGDFKELIKNFNRMTANLRFQYDELEKISLQDYLTGLANRRYFEQQLKLELERACRLGHVSTVLMLDIDDFKKINDRFGHLEGDKALKALSTELNKAVREVDLPARYGGEEFIVLLPETSLEQASIVAEKIREKISRIQLPSRKGNIAFTISIGIAGTEQDPNLGCASVDEACQSIIKHADKALYQAKRNGKNRVERL